MPQVRQQFPNAGVDFARELRQQMIEPENVAVPKPLKVFLGRFEIVRDKDFPDDGRIGPPNHVRYVFLDPRARRFFDPWSAVAHDTARILRSEAGRDPHDSGPAELIDELSRTSAEFRAVWGQHDVRLPAAGRHLFHHPLVGDLDLVFEATELRADPGLTLLLATADGGSPTESALRRLAATLASGR